MPNENLALGLVPINMPYGNVRSRLYYCDGTQNTLELFIGDPVVMDTTGTVIRAGGADGSYVLGAVLGVYDSNKSPIAYLTSSTAGYVLVADDPNQQYLIQEDGDTTPLTTAAVGGNCSMISASGSTFRNRSGFMLDSTGITTSTNAQLRILGKQERVNNDVGAYAKWIVKINYAQAMPDALGDSI